MSNSSANRRKDQEMRAIVAEEFGGYQNLKLADIPKPAVSDGRVLVRMTAAGVTPLDHTILSGSFPMAKAPLVLGNEGTGVVEGTGDDQFPDGSRVMFTGPYGVFENGAFSEWVAVKKEHLCLIPVRSEPENDYRCDELDLEGCQHQKLLAVLSACICLGRSMDDDYRASQVGPGQADRR